MISLGRCFVRNVKKSTGRLKMHFSKVNCTVNMSYEGVLSRYSKNSSQNDWFNILQLRFKEQKEVWGEFFLIFCMISLYSFLCLTLFHDINFHYLFHLPEYFFIWKYESYVFLCKVKSAHHVRRFRIVRIYFFDKGVIRAIKADTKFFQTK